MCEVIESCRDADGPHGPRAWQGQDGYADETLILFGDLFDAYAHISDKVVGMLLRARKHGLLWFEGETLFQGQDDEAPILLLMSSKRAREKMAASGLQSGTVAVGISPANGAGTINVDA